MSEGWFWVAWPHTYSTHTSTLPKLWGGLQLDPWLGSHICLEVVCVWRAQWWKNLDLDVRCVLNLIYSGKTHFRWTKIQSVSSGYFLLCPCVTYLTTRMLYTVDWRICCIVTLSCHHLQKAVKTRRKSCLLLCMNLPRAGLIFLAFQLLND